MSKTRHEKRVRPKNDPYKRVKSHSTRYNVEDADEDFLVAENSFENDKEFEAETTYEHEVQSDV